MKDELVRKIQCVLDRRITNEKQVVYLLVKVRTLMERNDYDDQVLKMFCNWVVHTTLSYKTDGSSFILGEFDRHFAELFEKHKAPERLEHTSLGAFRRALIQCFKHCGHRCLSQHIG